MQLCHAAIEVYTDGLEDPNLWLMVSDECDSSEKCVFAQSLSSFEDRSINKVVIEKLKNIAEQQAYDQGYLCSNVEVNIVSGFFRLG